MANRTSWVSGNSPGLTWTAGFNAADIDSLPNNQGVLSGITINNASNLDQFLAISMQFAFASAQTPTAPSSIALWFYPQVGGGGTVYGDGQFTAGTQAALTPTDPPLMTFNLPLVSTTNFYGIRTGLELPPFAGKLLLMNYTGFTLASSGLVLDYATFNINLND